MCFIGNGLKGYCGFYGYFINCIIDYKCFLY